MASMQSRLKSQRAAGGNLMRAVGGTFVHAMDFRKIEYTGRLSDDLARCQYVLSCPMVWPR